MGSPKTFEFLWADETFHKKRHILTCLPYTPDNFDVLKARESILIQEAWKKYGVLKNQLDLPPSRKPITVEIKYKNGKKDFIYEYAEPDIGAELKKISVFYGTKKLCLNMTDGVPRGNQRGREVYLKEKNRIGQLKQRMLIKQKPTNYELETATKRDVVLLKRADRKVRKLEKRWLKKQSSQSKIAYLNAQDAAKKKRLSLELKQSTNTKKT